jgi:hypothetical protein
VIQQSKEYHPSFCTKDENKDYSHRADRFSVEILSTSNQNGKSDSRGIRPQVRHKGRIQVHLAEQGTGRSTVSVRGKDSTLHVFVFYVHLFTLHFLQTLLLKNEKHRQRHSISTKTMIQSE